MTIEFRTDRARMAYERMVGTAEENKTAIVDTIATYRESGGSLSDIANIFVGNSTAHHTNMCTAIETALRIDREEYQLEIAIRLRRY